MVIYCQKERKGLSSSTDYNKSKNVKVTLRLIIVFFTWAATFLKPDTESAFYTVLFVSSITSLYEYVIIYLETNNTIRYILSICGMALSGIYGVIAISGFCDLINLDVTNLVFSLGDKVPVRHPEQVTLSFYTIVPWMLLFPIFVGMELIIKRDEPASKSLPHPVRKKAAER